VTPSMTDPMKHASEHTSRMLALVPNVGFQPQLGALGRDELTGLNRK
jgi:hypothetical protein